MSRVTLQVKVKSGQGQIRSRSNQERCSYVGGLHLNQMHSCYIQIFKSVSGVDATVDTNNSICLN